MNWYLIFLVIHVLVAVGALGQLGVFGFMTRNPATANPVLMTRILKAASGGFVLMLLSGFGLLWSADWMYMHAWWFRIAFLLFIAMGALHGIASGTLRKGTVNGAVTAEALNKLKGLSTGLTILLVLIIILMEAKPF